MSVGCAAIGSALSWLSVPMSNLFDAALPTASVAVVAVAIGFKGPGGWAVDARLFGFRRIVMPQHRSHDECVPVVCPLAAIRRRIAPFKKWPGFLFSIGCVNLTVWLLNCLPGGMLATTADSVPLLLQPEGGTLAATDGVGRALVESIRGISLSLGVFALLIPWNALAANLAVAPPASAQSAAFARYVASTWQPSPFNESEPVVVEVHASLPVLYKESSLLAVRQMGRFERSEYQLLAVEGEHNAPRASSQRSAFSF